MKNYKDLDVEYKNLIMDYEANDKCISDYQDAILELAKNKKTAIDALIYEMLECQKLQTKSEMELLAAGFTEREIKLLAYQCYQTMKD